MTALNGYRKARFRDVEFLIPAESSFDGTFGAKTATHEFINSDRPLVEFLGKAGETFTVEAIINSNAFPLYNQQKKDFEEALSKPQEGVLIHPTEGRKVVAVVNLVGKRESLTTIGSCTYTINFKETTSKVYPREEGNKSLLLRVIDTAKDAVSSFFEGAFSPYQPRLSENFQKSKEFAEAGLQNINDAVATINTTGDVLSEYTRKYNAILSNINSIVANPSTYTETIESLWGSVLTITDNTAEAFGLNLGLVDNSESTTMGDSTVYQQIRRNEEQVAQFNNINAIVNAYNLVTDIDFESQEELDEALNNIEDVYSELINNVNEALVYNIQDVRNQARLLLDSLRGSLAKTITIYTSPTNTAALAYKYYGDIDRAEQIERINNISKPDLVEGELQILEF